jgi:hypothetical protein
LPHRSEPLQRLIDGLAGAILAGEPGRDDLSLLC